MCKRLLSNFISGNVYGLTIYGYDNYLLLFTQETSASSNSFFDIKMYRYSLINNMLHEPLTIAQLTNNINGPIGITVSTGPVGSIYVSITSPVSIQLNNMETYNLIQNNMIYIIARIENNNVLKTLLTLTTRRIQTTPLLNFIVTNEGVYFIGTYLSILFNNKVRIASETTSRAFYGLIRNNNKLTVKEVISPSSRGNIILEYNNYIVIGGSYTSSLKLDDKNVTIPNNFSTGWYAFLDRELCVCQLEQIIPIFTDVEPAISILSIKNINGEIYMVGQIFGSYRFGDITVNTDSMYNHYIGKLDSNNRWRWINLVIPNITTNSNPNTVYLSDNSRGVIAGHFWRRVQFVNGEKLDIEGSGSSDLYIADVSSSGDWLSSNMIVSNENVVENTIITNYENALYILTTSSLNSTNLSLNLYKL